MHMNVNASMRVRIMRSEITDCIAYVYKDSSISIYPHYIRRKKGCL